MSGTFKITRILHAGYIFSTSKTRVLFDPLFENPFSVNCHAFPPVAFDLERVKTERFDAVFISHYHDDHCSFESLALLDRETPIFVYCVFEEMLDLIRELGFANVTGLFLNETIEIGDVRVIPRLALDAEVDSVFEIHAFGFKVLNVVDSWLDPSTVERLEQSAPWDVVLWPFQTMRELAVLAPSRAEPALRRLPVEWLQQIRRLKPRAIVPSSCQFQFEEWSWMNHAMFPITYKQFAKEVGDQNPQAQVFRLEPGNSLELSQNGITRGESLAWIQPTGACEVDYDFRDDQKIPSTDEVSRLLKPLQDADIGFIKSYLNDGLIRRYSELPALSEGFFSQPRRWRLSVFDQVGHAIVFDYQIDRNQVLIKNDGLEAEWSTEIPAVKLLAALREGEALTSLYVRINTEADAVELVEDPLLRCLYEGAFASYQKAQLASLRERQK